MRSREGLGEEDAPLSGIVSTFLTSLTSLMVLDFGTRLCWCPLLISLINVHFGIPDRSDPSGVPILTGEKRH